MIYLEYFYKYLPSLDIYSQMLLKHNYRLKVFLKMKWKPDLNTICPISIQYEKDQRNK